MPGQAAELLAVVQPLTTTRPLGCPRVDDRHTMTAGDEVIGVFVLDCIATGGPLQWRGQQDRDVHGYRLTHAY